MLYFYLSGNYLGVVRAEMTQDCILRADFESQGSRAPQSLTWPSQGLLLGSLLQEIDITQLFLAVAYQSYRPAREHLQTKTMSSEPWGTTPLSHKV